VLAYRIFPYDARAAAGQPGHPLYEHLPQNQGRIDHPDYYVWYLSLQPEAAAAEVFGNLSTWNEDTFPFHRLAGSRKALGVYQLPDDLRVLDLDDPRALLKRHLRPTQVVTRNRAITQEWGHDIWDERDPHDVSVRSWQAIRWWSYQRPQWPILGSWMRPSLVRVDHLDLGHAAVQDAARALCRDLPSSPTAAAATSA